MKLGTRSFCLFFIGCLCSFFTLSRAATIDGELGLVHVPYATTLGKSKLLVNGQSANTMAKGTSYNGWYYHAISQLGAIYGINPWCDVWFNYRYYQDNPSKPTEQTGNLKIGTKYNFYNNRKLKYNLAGELLMICPTGKYANIPWEPFSSGQFEFQFNMVGSYLKYYHGVFGYIFHNDAGIGYTLGGRQPVKTPGESATHEMVIGLGGEYPILKDILVASGELSGRFILNPKTDIQSSEPWIVFTAGAKYFLSDILYLSGGLDVRLTGATNDNSVFNLNRPGFGDGGFYKDTGNYPAWKAYFDVNWLAYQKYRVVRKPGDKESTTKEQQDESDFIDLINDFGSVEVSQELQDKMKLYKELKMHQKETKEAEKELDEVRVKRKEAEKELQRLRQLLEEIE